MRLAAKRGFFGNHYHMDIGQFIIFCREQPVVVDLGGTVYTKETFSTGRYKNWVINSDGHNVPNFNGIGQLTAPQQDIKAAMLSNDEKSCVFKMDLTSAYPADAQLVKCLRTITYSYEDNSVEINDEWELKTDKNTVKIPLYTPVSVKHNNGKYLIGNMTLTIKTAGTHANVKKLDINDAKITKAWGNNIHKIELITSSGKKGSCKISFRCNK
jgi:hypothetical protein